MSEPLLALDRLSVAFGGAMAVGGLSLTLQRGETAAIVGESGSGKSVSMLALLGLLPPDATISGAALFEGRDLLALSTGERDTIRGRRIAMIFQEPSTALDPLCAVGAQIAAVLRFKRGLSGRAARRRAIELIDLVGLPQPARRARAFPHELSGGQRQRVAIAMAVAAEPDILIADEPTTALDVTVEARILDLIADLTRRLGMATILISHDLGLVSRFADNVHVMRHGRLVESGAAAQLLAAPRDPYTRLLVEADPPPRTPAPAAPTHVIANHVGVQFALRGGLWKRRHVLTAVDDASLTIGKGRTLGLVGESGSGKSTLGRALLGIVQTSGLITIEDRALSSYAPAARRRARRGFQAVFQDPYGALSPRLRVAEIVAEGLTIHEPSLSKTERDTRAIAALAEVRLDPALRDRFPAELSGGQRQRVAIARAMILKPRFVVLDEPTSALDRSVQRDILALLTDLQAAHGLTYLFISHDLGAIRAMADDVAVMKEGRIVESGPAGIVLDEPQHPYTRLLTAAAASRHKPISL